MVFRSQDVEHAHQELSRQGYISAAFAFCKTSLSLHLIDEVSFATSKCVSILIQFEC